MSNIQDLGTSTIPLAPDIRVSENGVLTLLSNLNPNKATGPDEISTKFLKDAWLMQLHQHSPKSSRHPLTKAKHQKIGRQPTYYLLSKRETSNPANYRPVTSVCCKVVEHIIHSHLMNFFVYHNILTGYQHGFRKKRSCESQVITTIQDLAIGIEFNTKIDAVLLDFSKAFDKWTRSVLSTRTRSLLVEGHFSSRNCPWPTLVPGIRPALQSKVQGQTICLMYRTITAEADANQLQSDLENLQQWDSDWQMHFNSDKCEDPHHHQAETTHHSLLQLVITTKGSTSRITYHGTIISKS